MMLSIILIVVISLRLFLSRSGSPRQAPATSAAVFVENLTYYHQVHGFSVRAPSSDWEINYKSAADSLRREDALLPVFENINPMMEMQRRDGDKMVALVKVGMIALAKPRTPRGLAAKCFEEIRSHYRVEKDTVRVIQSFTPLSAGILEGAYFMLEVPRASVSDPLTIWIVSFWVREQLGYSMICQTTKEEYVFLRDDFATIIESFRYLQ
jgi:hypothetical protein